MCSGRTHATLSPTMSHMLRTAAAKPSQGLMSNPVTIMLQQEYRYCTSLLRTGEASWRRGERS